MAFKLMIVIILLNVKVTVIRVCAFGVLNGYINSLKPQRTNNVNVLEVPSVQRLLQSLSNGYRNAGRLVPKSQLKQTNVHDPDRPSAHDNSRTQVPDVTATLDDTDGAFPTTSDEKKGNFEFNNGDAKGKGSYVISDNSIEIDVDMKLKQPTTSPTTLVTNKPNSTKVASKPTMTPTAKPEATPSSATSTTPSKTKPTVPTGRNSTIPKSSPATTPTAKSEATTASATSTTPSKTKPTVPIGRKSTISTSSPATTPTAKSEATTASTTSTTPSTTKPTVPTTTNSRTSTLSPATTPTAKPEATTANTTSTTPSTTKPTVPTPANSTSSPSKTTPSAENCTDSPFQKEALNTHNKYRAVHNAPAIKLSCEMTKQATEYARKIADLGSLVHSGYSDRPEQGENLSMGCSEAKGQTAGEAVKNWYDEVCKYTFGESGPQSGTEHFTQIIWKASVELGFGLAEKDENGMKCTYIVGRYKPQGNFDPGDSAYRTNVDKGSFDETYCNTVRKGSGLDGGYGLRRSQQWKTKKQV